MTWTWMKPWDKRLIELHLDNYVSSLGGEKLSQEVQNALVASVVQRARKEARDRKRRFTLADPHAYAQEHLRWRLGKERP